MASGSRILTDLNVRLIGRLDAPRTLVFSHGFGTDQTCFDPLLAGLKDHYRVVLFDHVGSGCAALHRWNPKRYSRLDAYAEDLRELAAALDLTDATLVGHSAGAIIGMLAAVKAPERFGRLVLIGASACYCNDADYEGGFTRDDLVELYRLLTVSYREWVDHFVPLVTGKAPGTPLNRYLAELLGRLRPPEALIMATAVLESDYRDWLPLVSQPTLLLQAREDAVVPRAAAEYLHRRIAGSRLELLEAQGHFPFFDVPREVVAHIRAFA